MGLIPGLGRSLGVGKGCPLQCSGLENSIDCSPPDSSIHRDSPGKNTGVGCHALFQGILPTQGLSPVLLHCSRILYSEPPGKSKNNGVGSLSLLHWIFPTQESNWGLLHCRQILYQLSYPGEIHIYSTLILWSKYKFLHPISKSQTGLLSLEASLFGSVHLHGGSSIC